MNESPLKNILVVRNDKLGDFMLAYPSFRLLKEHLPDARITALVPAYTRAAAEMCRWIDDVLVDPGAEAGASALAALLRARSFDAVVTLFSTTRVGYACWRARIPYRLAPASKLAQFFYNHRMVQRRSLSEKPEWAYNLDLAMTLLRDRGIEPEPLLSAPYLEFPADQTARLRARHCADQGIDAAARLVFVHPGSGGSAVNLDLGQYARLLQRLSSDRPLAFIVSAGPGEQSRAAELAALLSGCRVTIYASDRGLLEFAQRLAFADLFISGSTGPLHIAGALDVPTAAFYPRRRSATPLRWQTLNSPDRRLAFTPPDDVDERAMSAIDVEAAAAAISARFLR